MNLEQQAGGSLEIRERWTLLRWVSLIVAIGIIALVIPNCVGGGSCDRKEFRAVLVVAPLLIGLALWIADSTFFFDVSRREVRWSRRRLLTARTGTIPFDDITDVKQRANVDFSEQPARTRYRVALVTRNGDVYMSVQEAVRKSDEENVIALIRRTLALAVAVFVAVGCASVAPAPSTDLVAIVGVTIIDPSTSLPSATNQTILITNGVIEAVGPDGSIGRASGARRVDAHGKFAIPGLWDAHVHFMNTGVTALPVFVANGVTSVREMGGFIDSTRAWQARMRAGTLVGPRILTPGPILESPRYLQGVVERSERAKSQLALRVLPYRIGVADSLDAKRAIDSLVKLNVDFVKVRTSVSAEAYNAILREAHRAGLRIAAHQQGTVSIRNALDSGQTDLEHGILPPLSRLSDQTRDSIYRKFIEHHAFYTPTLAISRMVMLSGDSAARAIFSEDAVRLDERRAYASSWLLGWWRMQVDERMGDTASTRVAANEEAWTSSLRDVRRMHELGVQILAGTDAGSVLVYPGFGLHEELRLLVEEAGLAPRDALWSATIGPARFAKLEDRLGTIAAGKIADIVLLDADPLVDIRNTRRVFAVIQSGRVFSRSELDTILAEVRRTLRQ